MIPCKLCSVDHFESDMIQINHSFICNICADLAIAKWKKVMDDYRKSIQDESDK